MVKVYTLYLSSETPVGYPIAPIVDTALSVSWNINWDSFFNITANNFQPKKCRVKFLLTSKSGALVYNNTLGSLRANFTSPYCNNYNGVNLGLINAVNDPTNTSHRYLGDTTSSLGVDINMPTGNQAFTLTFMDMTENVLSVALEYQVWLYFEIEE